MIRKHKSGQAALIIVIVTMVTALGVAVSSITQSNLNLKETVYSTQTTQARACAEAGVERALADLEGDRALTGSPETLESTDTDAGGASVYTIDGCTYLTEIRNYPCSDVNNSLCTGDLLIPSLSENSVQQFNVKSDSGAKIDIEFNNNSVPQASLAVYLYKADSVQRFMFHCGDQGDAPSDFENLTADSNGKCSKDDIPTTGVNLVRVRPLYTSMTITVSGSGIDPSKPSGYLISSTGTSGQVIRNVNVYRYYSQMPAVFDEAVVSLGSGVQLN